MTKAQNKTRDNRKIGKPQPLTYKDKVIALSD